MALPYAYRITQYDPRDRDASGAYTGALDSISDEGPLEAAYLDAFEAFARELGVTQLAVRRPEVHRDSPDDRPLDGSHVGAMLFGADLAGFYDGALVDVAGARLLIQEMLRECELWCVLQAEGRMVVEIGWDMYMFIGASGECPLAAARAFDAGLFAETWLWPVSLLERTPSRLPADRAFWERVDDLVAKHGAVLLSEWSGWKRWHRITPGDAHPSLRPRSLVEVLRDLDDDVAGVLSGVTEDSCGPLVWEDAAGRLHETHEYWDPRTQALVRAEARRARLMGCADDEPPLLQAVNADPDGVIRACWPG
jgi:small subunit ribosomal protein S1